jgi:hypothetical protein
MIETTDADRKHAAELIYGNRPRDQVEAVARALAAERAKVMPPGSGSCGEERST